MRRVAVRAIIEKDGKLLLAKLTSYNGGLEKTYYCTIGGGLDDNEPLIDGLRREVVEETGIEPEIGKLLYIQQYGDKNDNIEFFFHVKNADDFMNINLQNTSHGQLEIQEIGFYDPTDHYCLPTFLKDIDIASISTQCEVQIFNYL